MNVSPSSNSVTSKATSLLEPSGSSAQTSEGGESKGFFASLKDALGLGEEVKAEPSKASKTSESGDVEKVASDSGDAEKSEKVADTVKKVDGDEQATSSKTASQSEDALLKGESGDKPATTDGKQITESKAADSNKAAASESGAQKSDESTAASAKEQAPVEGISAAQKTQGVESQSKPSVETDKPQPAQANTSELKQIDPNSADASKASAAMSEGNKLLGQLDEANKTLQAPTNGKALPQAAATPVAGFNAQSSQAIKADLASNTGPITPAGVSAAAQQPQNMAMMNAGVSVGAVSGEAVLQTDAVSKVNTTDALAPQQLVALEQKVAMMTNGVPVSQLDQAQVQQLMQQGVTPQQLEQLVKAEQSAMNSASQLSQSSQPLTQAELELAAEVEMHTQAINQLNTQIEATEVVVNELETKQLSGEDLSDAEKATLAKASSELVVLQQQRTQLVGQASQLYSQAPTTINWDTPVESSEVATDNLEEWAATAAVAAGATQHAMQQNVAADKAQAALAQSNQAQTVQMQQAQQAAAQQASNAASASVSAQASSVDLNLAAAHNVAANPMGTEMLAAKAASKDAILKVGAEAAALAGLGRTTGKDDSKESSFAQQIASAAGAQGTTPVGSTPTRAEIQAAQQAPLQLTKELANEQVAEKVQMMMSKNLKNLDIRLDPPELGQLKIRMTMNNDVANVHFTVTNQQARDVIEQTLPRLREMLAQQGMQLADSSVQQQSTGQGQDRYNSGEGGGQSGSGSANDGQGDENLDSSSNLELNVTSKRDGISYYA
ncbi:flagellar hook-length control protein FliK [Vibrio fortis]|uniref:Flagellar hook-length control protein FliK n=1 Tax=Vibrio fortis TaxID=212667 RepID=A0A066V207_9VIBR|nr:flagellar hook-length control protein FliK [Vibrio fortis]KDN30603.1 flagellar hook-length control protein FliK [Vibrio fortis]